MSHRLSPLIRSLSLLVFLALAVCAGCADEQQPGEVTNDDQPASQQSDSDNESDDESTSEPSNQSEPDEQNDGGDQEGQNDDESDGDNDEPGENDDANDQPDNNDDANQDDSTDDGDDQGDDPDPTAFLEESDSKAMWLWDETPGAEDLITDADGAKDELMDFLEAPHDKPEYAIDRLFFEARGHETVDVYEELRPVDYDPLVEADDRPDLREFLQTATDQGVAVEYLDGQAIWLADDDYAEVPKQICEDVVAFNEAADEPGERFAGIHLDIEPHTVTTGPYAGEWWEDRLPDGYNAEWTDRWKDILQSCRATLDDYEDDTGHRMVLSIDVGADYAFYNEPLREFLDHDDGPVDYLGVMNYYDNSPNAEGDPSFFYGEDDGTNTVGGVEQNLQLWEQIPLMFGMETGPPAIAPPEASFYDDGYEAMYQVVDELFDDYADTRSVGAAIHHYSPDAYRDLDP